MQYKRNEAVADVIGQHPTAGLPLFQNENEGLSKREKYLVTQAPRTIPLATDTRKLSHVALTFSKDILNEKQLWVFNGFKELRAMGYEDATNEEVRVHLKTEINRVVGRTFELRERGVIGKSQKRICRVTGRVVTAWRITKELEE
jgi:hypothetical protein